MYCLGLDVGERRIGVAVGEVLARPLTTLKRRSKERDYGAIGRLVREHKAETVVTGLPLNMDGSEGSTEEARRAMIDAGRAVAERRHRVDQVAAAVILQSYLDDRSGSLLEDTAAVGS